MLIMQISCRNSIILVLKARNTEEKIVWIDEAPQEAGRTGGGTTPLTSLKHRLSETRSRRDNVENTKYSNILKQVCAQVHMFSQLRSLAVPCCFHINKILSKFLCIHNCFIRSAFSTQIHTHFSSHTRNCSLDRVSTESPHKNPGIYTWNPLPQVGEQWWTSANNDMFRLLCVSRRAVQGASCLHQEKQWTKRTNYVQIQTSVNEKEAFCSKSKPSAGLNRSAHNPLHFSHGLWPVSAQSSSGYYECIIISENHQNMRDISSLRNSVLPTGHTWTQLGLVIWDRRGQPACVWDFQTAQNSRWTFQFSTTSWSAAVGGHVPSGKQYKRVETDLFVFLVSYHVPSHPISLCKGVGPKLPLPLSYPTCMHKIDTQEPNIRGIWAWNIPCPLCPIFSCPCLKTAGL